MSSALPEVYFDESRAERVFPRLQAKQAVLVRMPVVQGGDTPLPSFIRPEWDGAQVFMGDYYLIIKGGVAIYGSAKEQWENMHQEIHPGYWVKTAVPLAYQVTEPCRIVTFITDKNGTIQETSHPLKTSDWLLRQPGGEVQHVKLKKWDDNYYTHGEACKYGLDKLTDQEFARWAIARARNSILV